MSSATAVSAIYEIALSQVGVEELTGHNDGEAIKRYALEEGFPWCAAFVCWVYEQAGYPIHLSLRDRFALRSVSKMQRRASRTGVAMGHNISPRRGDVVFFRNTAGSAKHVGIVVSVIGEVIHTVEGNTGNAVRSRTYHRGTPRITGYARFLDGPTR